MKWEDILKNTTKIVNIAWEEDEDRLPSSTMVPTRLLKDKSKVLEYLSKNYGVKATGYKEYDFF